MELDQVKKMAAAVMKIGVNRVKIANREESLKAMTREDVRGLVRKGYIKKKRSAGSSRVRARKTAAQKKKGRKKGPGSKKGKWGTRVKRKKVWITGVRALRRHLLKMKPELKPLAYRKLYGMVNGGFFKSKAHLETYLKEKKLKK